MEIRRRTLTLGVHILLCLLSLGIAIVPSSAYRDGIAGRTQTGCGGTTCHGSRPSPATSVSLSGNLVVDPNTVNTFTLTVQHSSQAVAGFNFAAFDQNGQPAGMLQYPSGQSAYVKLLNGELTHRDRRTMSGTPRQAQWQLQWRSPAEPGKYTLRAVANAANGDNAASPVDEWNFLAPVTVTVRGMILISPAQAGTVCAGDTVLLEWTSYGISATSIAYSTNNGQTWQQVTTVDTREGRNTYRFLIPTAPVLTTQQWKLRLISADNELLYTDSPTLTVHPKTTIRTQPQQPAPQCEGGSVTLSVNATGVNLSFEWQKDGTAIAGATSAQLVLSNLTPEQAGTYKCVVSGNCGTVSSNSIKLTVKPKPRLVAQSSDTTVIENTRLELYATWSNDSAATYQWLKNGSPLPGATSRRLIIEQVTPRDSGVYVARATTECGSAETEPIRVQVSVQSSVEYADPLFCQVYPQPARDHIIITAPTLIYDIGVYDLTGRVLLHRAEFEPKTQVALSLVGHQEHPLTPGVYILRVRTGERIVAAPIVVVQ
ncbi:MAG: immunoglobulin domain-containing protein [Chlorobi bacterium]|nr:immunoglobulin domain-containing protein [Chlorobiota bacterium]